MTFSVLTIYRLFFITQGDILFALTWDGRALKIKQTPYFSGLSCDKQTLTGISFDGEHTHIFTQSFAFTEDKPEELTSLFGYFYYPTLNANRKKMAVLEANLLKPRTHGELCIYQKKIKKWYQIETLDAKIKPPIFNDDDSLLYIDSESNLIVYFSENASNKITENVQCYNTSNNYIITFNGSCISLYDKKNFTLSNQVPASYVTALTFDEAHHEILYATSYENRHAIYAFNMKTNKTTLLLQTTDPVILMG